MYEKIEIKNFRSIKELEIQDFKTVNLFVGKNGCGKSTVLESMFLLTGPTNPELPIKVNIFRNYFNNVDDYMWKLLFKDLDVSQSIKISGDLSDPKQVRKLTIKPNYENVLKSKTDIIEDNSISSAFITGLDLELELTNVSKPIEKYLSRVILDSQGSKLSPATNYKETLYGVFINTKTMLDLTVELAKGVHEAILKNQISEVVQILQLIEPSIKDISIGLNNSVQCKVENKIFPLNFLGDGIFRILHYLIKIYEGKNGVLFIDEIENGLHYSSLEILWKAIFESAKKFNVQIFATTHSLECVRAFSSVYSESGNKNDDIRLYRIEKKGNEHKTIAFNNDELESAIESGWEIR